MQVLSATQKSAFRSAWNLLVCSINCSDYYYRGGGGGGGGGYRDRDYYHRSYRHRSPSPHYRRRRYERERSYSPRKSYYPRQSPPSATTRLLLTDRHWERIAFVILLQPWRVITYSYVSRPLFLSLFCNIYKLSLKLFINYSPTLV